MRLLKLIWNYRVHQLSTAVITFALVQIILVIVFDEHLLRSATAAGPWVLVADGDLVEEPVTIGTWEDVQIVLQSRPITGPSHITVTTAELDMRPYLRFSIFSANKWQGWVVEGGSVDVLTPDAADSHLRYYPAYGGDPAILTDDPLLPAGYSEIPASRIVGEAGIETLSRYGIPTLVKKNSQDQPLNPLSRLTTISTGFGLVLLVGGVIAIAIVLNHRRARVG